MKSRFLSAMIWVMGLYGVCVISGMAFLSWHVSWNSELMPEWGAAVFFISSTSIACVSIYRILLDDIYPNLKNTVISVLLPTVGIIIFGAVGWLADASLGIGQPSENQATNLFGASIMDIIYTVIPLVSFLVAWVAGINCAVSGEQKKIGKPRIRVPAYTRES